MELPKVLFCFAILGQICGLGLFFLGFMPLNLRGLDSTMNASRSSCAVNDNDGRLHLKVRSRRKPGSTRLVLMVLDALREDFIFKGNKMPYIQSLIRDNKTLSFLAKGHPPTVTLPRIKAIITGAIPQFIDVVMNFASVELKQDNVIAKFYQTKKNIIFFGDETWINLLPNCFSRHDGTTSFVVSDYTEVDDNVTRHLNEELLHYDWDVMVLHFLGLDHIGHSFGPYSPLISLKLLEMDRVIRNIIESLLKRSNTSSEESLFILTSDHGMNDVGGHGGSTKAEAVTPLVFVSPSLFGGKGKPFEERTVNQVDIAATISAFFDLGIPVHSVGALIVDLLQFHPMEIQKARVKENICQLAKQTGQMSFESASYSRILQCCEWKADCLANQSLDKLNGLLQAQSAFLSAQFSGYQPEKMLLGIALLLFSLLFSMGMISVSKFFSFPKTQESLLGCWLLIAVAIHSLSMASTSYIEEEHQMWYFVLTMSVLVLFLSERSNIDGKHSAFAKGFKFFFLLLFLRIMRGWNQTGVKWLGQKDLANFLTANNCPFYLWLFILTALVIFYRAYFWTSHLLDRLLYAVALSLIFCYKSVVLFQWHLLYISCEDIAKIVFLVSLFLAFKPLVLLVFMKARIKNGGYCVMDLKMRSMDAGVTIFPKKLFNWVRPLSNYRAWLQNYSHGQHDLKELAGTRMKQGVFHALLLIYLLVLRPHNLAWIGVITAVEATFSSITYKWFDEDHDTVIIIANFVFARASFHAQGLSNALSSIDVSAGLIGFSYYSPVFAGFLVSIATFGIHIFWLHSLAFRKPSESQDLLTWKVRSIYNILLALENVVFCIVVFFCRYHTFVWTVFAPKFLFVVTRSIFVTTLTYLL